MAETATTTTTTTIAALLQEDCSWVLGSLPIES